MSKIKTNKEYAIKVVHPEFGDFYFSYDGHGGFKKTYIFTKNLSKVVTWKTSKFAKKQIDLILSYLETDKGKILLSLGEEVDENVKNRTILSRKKHFYPVNLAKSKLRVNDAIINIKGLNSNMIVNSKNLIKSIDNLSKNIFINNFESSFDDRKMFLNLEHTEESIKKIKDSLNVLGKFYNDSIFYVDEHKTIKNYEEDVDVYLDMVDASNNFRGLKMRTLKKLEEK